MTTTTVTGNSPLVTPLALLSKWAKSTDADAATLKGIADGFSVPSYVGPGSGTIGSQRANLTDDDIEKCIRDWVWRNVNWTGSDQATSPALANNKRSLDIYRWKTGGTGPTGTVYSAGNPGLNSGKGPTMACSTIHFLYLGLLAAYGIAGRPCHGRDSLGNVDITAEYWSPAYAKWVHVLAHVNEHFVGPKGVPLSLFEWAAAERNNGTRSGIVTPVYLDSSAGRNFLSNISATDWVGYSAYIDFGRGNAPVLSANADPGYTAVSPREPTGLLATTMARGLNDVVYTINSLRVTLEKRPSGILAAQCQHNLTEPTASPFLVKRPQDSSFQSGQVDPSGAYAFWPVTGQTWQFEALGTLGNTTNIVVVAFT